MHRTSTRIDCALWLVWLVGCGSAQAPASDHTVPAPPSAVAAFDPPPPELRLPRHFTPTRYSARLALDPAKPDLAGEIAIEGTLDRRSAVIWLHGKHLEIVSAVARDGTHEVALTVAAKGDLLEVRPARPLDAGRWTLAITYRGKIEQNGFEGAFLTKLGDDAYVATQFQSTAARLVFPCLDEPDRKVPWQLTLDVPKGLVATTNTMPTGTTSIDPTHDRIAFAETRPLPSYLVAFGVGPFEVLDAGKAKSGPALRVVTPRGTATKVAFLVSALPKIVDTLEAWFKIPFPYPKLDILVVPSLRGGAMENAGMITTDARGVMDENASARERYSIVSLIGHETAHQWFGDLVTPAWWDDIWLNESFATWIEDKVLVGFDETWPTEAIGTRQAAFGADELLSSRRIRQPIESEGDIHNAFDSITYPKGSTVLRMIEHQMGETAFRSAIQHYLEAHADGNATSADLFGALDRTAGAPLGALATSWFDQVGVPEVAMDLTCTGSGKARLALAQKRYLPDATNPPAQQTWTIPVCVAFEGAKHERLDQCTVLATPKAELELPVCPGWFAPAGDYGYYHARLAPKALEAIRDKAWKALTTEEHISIYDDAYLFARSGSPSLELLWSLAQKLGRGGNLRELSVSLGDIWAAGDGATGIPRDITRVLPKDLLPAARAKSRAESERLAKKYGLAPRPDEDVATAIVRSDLAGVVAWTHSTALDGEAKRLVAHYRDLPIGIMSPVVYLAANADPKVVAQLRADFAKERDPGIHGILLGTLVSLRDPRQHHAMIESLANDPMLAPEDLARMWSQGDDEGRADNEAYLRAHLDQVLARLPNAENDDFPLALALIYPFTRACDPARRDEIAAYVTKHFSAIPSGARPVKQAIERMDNCVARKKRLEPSLRAWLNAKRR